MRNLVFITVLIIFTLNATYAYRINPLNRSFTASQKNHFFNKISEPVHEKITLDALEKYEAKCSSLIPQVNNCLSDLKDSPVIYNSIIRGNWWSDDPNQLLYEVKYPAWAVQLKDAERRAKNKKYVIDGKYKMMYRSHYGDLQFMHSMASKDEELPEITRDNILMWIEFLYKVSTGELTRTTKFKEVNVQGFNKFFKRQSESELQFVLQQDYRLSRSDDFQLHALGAILHTIQDSYSESHTERDFKSSENCPDGKINRFLSYTYQNPDKHGMEDSKLSYSKSLLHKNNPLNASEQLIEFSLNKADWESEVLPYLTKTVFCLDNPEPSGPGRF